MHMKIWGTYPANTVIVRIEYVYVPAVIILTDLHIRNQVEL